MTAGPFMGWQRQAHGPTVQQAIEEAIAAITQEEVTLHAAGRTDAGVHALAMTAHVDIAKAIAPLRLADGINAKLRPLPVAILSAARRSTTISTRASPASGGAISTGSSIGGRRWRSRRAAPGGCRSCSTPTR